MDYKGRETMHIRVNRDVLLQAFSHGQSVVEKRSTLLILGHTLIEARGGVVALASTDMDLSLSETISCEILEEGELCVPTLLVYEILKKLRAGVPVDLIFEGDATQMILSAGRSRFEIPCITADEFPRILQHENAYPCQIILPALILKNLLETVGFAMSTDEMRYTLNGINISYVAETNRLRAVATDRHRLASVEIEAPNGTNTFPSIIIGKKTINEMIHLLDEAVEPITLSVSDTRIELTVRSKNSTALLGSRLVDGSFPEYEMVLNMEHENKLIAGTKVFAEAVDRVGTVINDKSKMIQIELSRNLLKCSATVNTSGMADEDIDIDYDEGPSFVFNFNVRYLLDVAQHINTDEFEITFTNPDTAIAIRPIGLEGVYFALMPLAPQAAYTEQKEG